MHKHALRVCAFPGCNELVETGYCPAHAKPQAPRAAGYQRPYNGAWPKISARFLRENPLCVMCGRPAELVDHIMPLSQGGDNSAGNLRSMCRSCHGRRHAFGRA